MVTHAARNFSDDALGIYNLRVDQPLTPEIKLLGANRDRDEVLSGETVLLTLFWQAVQKPAQGAGVDFTAEAAEKLVSDFAGPHLTRPHKPAPSVRDCNRNLFQNALMEHLPWRDPKTGGPLATIGWNSMWTILWQKRQS